MGIERPSSIVHAHSEHCLCSSNFLFRLFAQAHHSSICKTLALSPSGLSVNSKHLTSTHYLPPAAANKGGERIFGGAPPPPPNGGGPSPPPLFVDVGKYVIMERVIDTRKKKSTYCMAGEAESRACQLLDAETGMGVTCTRRDR